MRSRVSGKLGMPIMAAGEVSPGSSRDGRAVRFPQGVRS